MKMKVKEPKFKYKQVMLLDDNELDNFINKKMIEASYFSKNTYVNTNGKSALEFLNNLGASGIECPEIYPQVIFVDLNMPMMDGFQFIEHFKSNLEKHIPRPKLVILTSSVYDEDRQKSSALSEDIIFLNKPLTSDMLINI